MKTLALLFFSALLQYNSAFSQDICKIFYDYDANGQRVKRYHHCYDPNEPGILVPFTPVLYPNPTSGRFNINFNELLETATLTVFSIDGGLIGQTDAGPAYEITYDLADQMPGSYVVTLTG